MAGNMRPNAIQKGGMQYAYNRRLRKKQKDKANGNISLKSESVSLKGVNLVSF
jgi:hypothetical protein